MGPSIGIELMRHWTTLVQENYFEIRKCMGLMRWALLGINRAPKFCKFSASPTYIELI